MSKSLCQKILSEVEKRQREQKAEIKQLILSELTNKLNENLETMTKFDPIFVILMQRSIFSEYPDLTKIVATELGFTPEMIDPFGTFKFTIPNHKKGNKRTLAQLKLYRFNLELSKRKKEARSSLLEFCTHLKRCLEEGSFEYSKSADNSKIIINIKSDEPSKSNNLTEFEISVITDFFKKFNINFVSYPKTYPYYDASHVWVFEIENKE